MTAMALGAHEPPPLLPESGTIRVNGCSIRWYAGGCGDPTLVLIHGGGAHAGWWELVLPGLSARQRVVALDLSGHGDSGHRQSGYPTMTWVAEVAAVLREVVGGAGALVGHSMGGRIATTTAAHHPELISALVTLDSVIPPHGREPVPAPRSPHRKIYESEAQILGAFRLKPPQPPAAAEVMARLARRSITRLADGRYTWKFDPAIFAQMKDRFAVEAEIPRITCPVTIVQGGLSTLTSPAMADEYQVLLGRELGTVVFSESRHHIPLDAPDELLALLGRLPGTRPV